MTREERTRSEPAKLDAHLPEGRGNLLSDYSTTKDVSLYLQP